MDPRLAAQLVNTAHAANASRDYATAHWWCRQALQIAPEMPEAWFNLGIALRGLGQAAQASEAFGAAAERTLDDADAQNSIGLQYFEMGALEPAEQRFARSIELAPDYAFPHVNLGRLQAARKQYDDAIALFRKAIVLQPDLAAAQVNLGSVLIEQRRVDEARAACLRALELDPSSPEALNNYGLVLSLLGQSEAAAQTLRRAVELNPQFFDAWNNLAGVYWKLKRYLDAAECFERCLQLNPHAEYIAGALVKVRMTICDWADRASDLRNLEQKIAQGKKVADPFVLLSLTSSATLQKQATELFARDRYPEDARLGAPRAHAMSSRRRVGYYSADFRNHAVTYLMAEVFELHDRSKFELIAFSFGSDPDDAMSRRVRSAFDQFIVVNEKSDTEIAMLSRSLEIDIAVDLGGYTESARPGIFALRAAPIQVAYLGYLGTMGAPYFDYLLADAVLIPEGHRRFYTEQVAYLPSYQANDSKREISRRVFTRGELGLPDTGFVFCSFNNSYKITPEIFDRWMRILRQVDGSVLFLYVDNGLAMENLKKEVSRRGIDAGRVVMTGERLERSEYLARFRAADLFLDTLPYNAGTTASDALWAGLPVLTCLGETFSGRMAASVLHAIDLPELIAADMDEYEAMAVALATEGGRLTHVRQRLEAHRMTTRLFDSARFTRELEAAFTAMHDRYLAGLAPTHLDMGAFPG